MTMRENAIRLIMENKVTLIGKSEKMGIQYEVIGDTGIYTVRIFQKKGRTLCTCTCFNGTIYCNSPVICKHHLAVLIIWMVQG